LCPEWLKKADSYVKRLDRLLLAFVIAGVIMIVSFGFGHVLPLNPFYVPGSPESWMRGSVLWTMLMSVYYVNFATRIEGAGARVVVWASLGVFLVLTFLLGGGHGPGGPAVHMWMAALVGFLMCAIDGVIFRAYPCECQGARPCECQREAASKRLMFADLPSLAAFLLVGLYVSMRPGNSHIFVSGAIAFQLFSGKVVFIAIEANVKGGSPPDATRPSHRTPLAA
jgi:hypothetical protein